MPHQFVGIASAVVYLTAAFVGARSSEIAQNSILNPKFLDVARLGLPHCGHACKTIVVVGAGVAGLTAAELLQRAGHSVVVLEASTYAGGRILTTDDGIDLGAMRFPEAHAITSFYVKQKFALPTREFPLESDNAFVFINGVLARVRKANANPDMFNFPVAASERGKTAGELWSEAVRPIVDDVRERGWDFVVAKYGHMSISEYLKGVGLSDGAIDMIGAFTNSDELFETSILENIRDETTLAANAAFYSIVGGSARLVDALARSLAIGTVRLRCEVTAVRQRTTNGGSQTQVLVAFSERSPAGKVQHRALAADRVLITATAAATLAKIAFSPELPERMVTALRLLHYDMASKIVLRFSRRFWELDDGICGGHSTTDLPIRFVWYPSSRCNYSAHDADEGGALIASYTWGQDSLRLTGMPDDAAIRLALDNLAKLHGAHIGAWFLNGTVKHWQKDAYALGAFALFTPGQEAHLSATLAAPADLVHIAGEYTVPNGHGWVEGAKTSGIREAVELNDDGQAFDVAIVGGGPVGLATAWRAALRGLKVVVVERYSFGNQNASSSGERRQFRQMYEEAHLAKLAIRSVALWRQLETEANVPFGSVLNLTKGHLFFGDATTGDTNEGNFAKIIDTSRRLLLGIDELNRTALEARYGQAFSALPQTWLGIYHNESGLNDVRATIGALRLVCAKLGVVLRDWELIENISAPATDMTVPVRLETNRGSVLAKRVVLTPGPYAAELLRRRFGLELDAKLWEIPWLSFRVLNYSAAARLPSWYAFGGSSSSLFYGFPLAPNATRLAVGPAFVFGKFESPDERVGRPDPRQLGATVEFVRKHMAGVLDADDVVVEQNTCLVAHVPDGGFVLDFVPATSSRIALFAAGWGFKFVPVFGEILAHMAATGAKPDDFEGERFSIERVLLKSVASSRRLEIGMGAGLGSAAFAALLVALATLLLLRKRRQHVRATEQPLASLTNGVRPQTPPTVVPEQSDASDAASSRYPSISPSLLTHRDGDEEQAAHALLDLSGGSGELDSAAIG